MTKELDFRLNAMRGAGLIPDDAVADDAVWRGLYNDNLSVRLAYDLDKYGKAPPLIPEQTFIKSWKREDVEIKPYTPGQDTRTVEEIYDSLPPTITTPPLMGKSTFTPPIEGTFKDITPVPEQKREPMSRATLIATARGHATTFSGKDDYFAWLLDELADQLEAAVDPDDATNLED